MIEVIQLFAEFQDSTCALITFKIIEQIQLSAKFLFNTTIRHIIGNDKAYKNCSPCLISKTVCVI